MIADGRLIPLLVKREQGPFNTSIARVHRLIHVDESIGLLTSAHTGSVIANDNADVVVILVVGELFQHQPHLSLSFRSKYLTLPDFSIYLQRHSRLLFILVFVFFCVDATVLKDLLSFIYLVIGIFCHSIPSSHFPRFQPNVL